MGAIRLSAVIGEDHQLIIQVPEDIPAGPIELIIQVSSAALPAANPARETARTKLAVAGLLSTAHYPPPGMRIPTDEEVLAAGILPIGARPSEELIDEDRGEA